LCKFFLEHPINQHDIGLVYVSELCAWTAYTLYTYIHIGCVLWLLALAPLGLQFSRPIAYIAYVSAIIITVQVLRDSI